MKGQYERLWASGAMTRSSESNELRALYFVLCGQSSNTLDCLVKCLTDVWYDARARLSAN